MHIDIWYQNPSLKGVMKFIYAHFIKTVAFAKYCRGKGGSFWQNIAHVHMDKNLEVDFN